MDVQDVVKSAGETLTVQRVYGEPYEKNGTTVIPAATMRGGAGGGEGESPEGKGGGTGFGVSARPAGAYVIRGGEVTWQPAVDVNRIVLAGGILGLAALLVLRSIAKARARTRRVQARHPD